MRIPCSCSHTWKAGGLQSEGFDCILQEYGLAEFTQRPLPHCCVAQPFQHPSVLHLEVSVRCGDGEKAELTVEGSDGGRLPGNREGGSGVLPPARPAEQE